MGPRGFWIALAIALFYLIARPHIGTVWHLTMDYPERGLTLHQVQALPSGLTPITGPTVPPGFGPLPPGASLPSTRFIDKRDCFNAEMRFETSAGVNGVYCSPRNALLWGW